MKQKQGTGAFFDGRPAKLFQECSIYTVILI